MSTEKFNPKLVIDFNEYGNPFDQLEDGLNWLMNKIKSNNYEAQINGNFNTDSVTRYAVNQVTQHTDLQTISFSLKLVDGKKSFNSSTTLLGEKGLQLLYDQAVLGIKSSPEVPFYQGLPNSRSGSMVNLIGKEWSIEDRADAVIETVNYAEEIDKSVKTAGTISHQKTYHRLISTQGIDSEDSTSINYFKVNSIIGPVDNRGYGQEETFWRYNKPNIEKLTKDATQTAKDTTKLITLDAKEYEVLLNPQATSNLLDFIQFGADPVSFQEGNSYTSDRLGDQIFDEKITIRDLPKDPKRATFVKNVDNEGISTENRNFYEKGVLKFIPYDSFSASKYLEDKNMTTGHHIRDDFFSGAIVGAAVVENGDRSIEKQISEMEDGLWIKNFWYIRFTKRKDGGLTGLTRNGLYHVKNGEIQGPVRNLRFTESFVRAFEPNNVISVGNESTMYEINTCPSIHLKRFRFSSIAHTDKE